MDELLHRLLAEAVGRYLDAVDRLAAGQQAVVGGELRRLTAAWRSVLGLHRPAGARTRCAGCGRVHLPAPGRRGSMCTVWRVASAYFVRADPEGGVMLRR